MTDPSRLPSGASAYYTSARGIGQTDFSQRTLDAILADYDPDTHPIIGVLTRGAPGLLKLAQRHRCSPWTDVTL